LKIIQTQLIADFSKEFSKQQNLFSKITITLKLMGSIS